MIGLIDVDSVLPNYALMKISSYYKSLGEPVEFVQHKRTIKDADKDRKQYTKIYASTIFTRSRSKCEQLKRYYGDAIEIGGPGWCLKKELPSPMPEEQITPTFLPSS